MGLAPGWEEEFSVALKSLGLSNERTIEGNQVIYFLKNQSIVITLVSHKSAHEHSIFQLQARYGQSGQQLIILWEDIWQTKKQQVMSRLTSLTGNNKKIHGRNCGIILPGTNAYRDFTNQHHLGGYAKAKYKVALTYEGEIAGVAGFNSRPMPARGEPGYISAELVRFCTKSGVTIVGGLGKLIKYYACSFNPGDIMTYADKEWSSGKSYKTLGFKLTGETPPIYFWLDRETGERHTENSISAMAAKEKGFARVFNSGNLKYLLSL